MRKGIKKEIKNMITSFEEEPKPQQQEMGGSETPEKQQKEEKNKGKMEEKKEREEGEKKEENKEEIWEELEPRTLDRLIEDYLEKEKLNKESQEFVNKIISEELAKQKIAFLIDWFNENEKNLRDKGYSVDVSGEMKMRMAIQAGALEEIRKNEKYKERWEERKNLITLLYDSQKEVIPLDSQYLLLNFLDKKNDEMIEEIEKMKQGGRVKEVEREERELEELFKARKELATMVTGRDLEKEAGEEVLKRLDPKEKYIENHRDQKKEEIEGGLLIEYFREEWEKISGEEKEKYEQDPLNFAKARMERIIQDLNSKGIALSEKDFLSLVKAGYDPENFSVKGFIRELLQLKEDEALSKKEFSKFLEEKKEEFGKFLDEKSEKDLENEWERQYRELIREEMENKIHEIAKAPEKAEGGVEKVYQRAKDKLIAEWEETKFKKGPKTKEEAERIARRFTKETENPESPKKLIDGILERKGPLKNLTGDWEKDKEIWEKFFKAFFEALGYKVPSEVFKKVAEKIEPKKEEYKKDYKKMVKEGGKGLLKLIFWLPLAIIGVAALGFGLGLELMANYIERSRRK